MTITLRKTALSIFLLLTFSNLYPMPPVSWDKMCTQHNLLWLAAAATTALVTAILSHNLYQTYVIPHERFIENCRTFYGTLHKDIQASHAIHYNNAQMSDWELKETIVEEYGNPYPFITYHALLTKNCWKLKKHLTDLHKLIKQINIHKNHLATTHTTESTHHIKELLVQLEVKGMFLQNYIIKTTTLIMILKNRIKLFKEYSDDCYNWSQQEKTPSDALTRFC